MPLFVSLLKSAETKAAATGSSSTANLASSNTEIIAAKAQETAAAGIFPAEVAFVVLGCLMISGVLLLMREAKIEQARG